jgi:uncharacterized protein YigA (DUF484 family)
MRDEDVAHYLQEHPQFFEDHTELLESIALPHPHGGRTVSLSERQLLALREKNKTLDGKLHELLTFARENDELQLKVHQFTCALFGARDLDAARDIILYELRERFAVPHVALNLWEVTPPSAEVLTFADQTPQPVCLHRAMYDTQEWFGEAAAHLRSFAYLPLRDGESSIGLLILASEDVQRFYPEMGTLFLRRVAEIVSAALKPHL